MDILDHIRDEKEALKKAPLAFVFLALLAFIGAVLVMDWLHSDRFASLGQQISTTNSINDLLKQRIEAKDEQLSVYRNRLLDNSPSGAKEHRPPANTRSEQLSRAATRFSNATNKELIPLAKKLAQQMRGLALTWQHKIDEARGHGVTNGTDMMAASENFEFEYENKYQADAIVLRDEILSRLPLVQRPMYSDPMYSRAVNPGSLQEIANDLDRLASLLPMT